MIDVEEAYRLHREAVKQSATDPQTGRIDLGIITTGVSSETRKKRQEVAGALKVRLKIECVLCTVYRLPCTVYSVQYTVYSVHVVSSFPPFDERHVRFSTLDLSSTFYLFEHEH